MSKKLHLQTKLLQLNLIEVDWKINVEFFSQFTIIISALQLAIKKFDTKLLYLIKKKLRRVTNIFEGVYQGCTGTTNWHLRKYDCTRN
jgi:hypothetical protein